MFFKIRDLQVVIVVVDEINEVEDIVVLLEEQVDETESKAVLFVLASENELVR